MGEDMGETNKRRGATLASAAAIVVAIALPCHAANAALAANWPQYGLNGGQSGDDTTERAIGTKNVSQLQLVESGGSVIQSPGLVLNKGVIYSGSNDGKVYALSAQDFSVLWSTPQILVNLSSATTPAVAGRTLVTPCYGTLDGNGVTGLCGYNASTGAARWNTLCDDCGLINSPSVDGNLAFYYYNVEAGVAGTVYVAAANTKNGKIVWQFAQPYHCPDNGLGSSQPVPVANGHVYAVLGCQGQQQNVNEVCALEEANGTADWCTAYNDQYAEDIEANGTIYLTTDGTEQVMALDEATGAVKWTATTADFAFTRVATRNVLYLGLAHNNGIVALSAKTGAQLWAVSGGFGDFTVANGVLYTNVGGNNGYAIYALDAKSGATLWTSTEGNGGSNARAIFSNDTIYTGCYTLCAYHLP